MYLIKLPGALAPKYLCEGGDFTAVRSDAKRFSADDAIAKHGELSAVAYIEPVARNLADQLTAPQLSALAGMLGYKEAGCMFGATLKKTPALPHGFSMRDAALAYIDTLRAGVVDATPEART